MLNFVVLYNTFSEKTTSTVWDGSVAKKFNSGSGTSKDPYVISNGSEFAYFFSLIHSLIATLRHYYIPQVTFSEER